MSTISPQTVSSLLQSTPAIGTTVRVQGWVRTRRDSKAGLSFVQVHDGSCFAALQVVAPNTLDNYASEVQKLSAGCAVDVVGELVASKGKGQNVELKAQAVEVVGWVDDPETYPMAPKRHSMEHLRANAHLRPRTNLVGAITRVRNTLAQATHRFFHEQGFYWIHTPIVTTSDAEGAGDMFRVSTLDLERVARTVDIDALEAQLDAVLSSKLSEGELRRLGSAGSTQLFRLMQMLVEYLLHVQQTLYSRGMELEHAAQVTSSQLLEQPNPRRAVI